MKLLDDHSDTFDRSPPLSYHPLQIGSVDSATEAGRMRLAPVDQLAGSDQNDYSTFMAKRKRYLTATLPDGYVKTIGPTSVAFTHYWRIVADLGGGRTDVFWGHTKSLREANAKRVATADAARQRGWIAYSFDVVALTDEEGIAP